MAEAGRLRKLQEQVQALVAQLRSLDFEQTRGAYPSLFELVRCVNCLVLWLLLWLAAVAAVGTGSTSTDTSCAQACQPVAHSGSGVTMH